MHFCKRRKVRRELRLCQDHLADHFATHGTENRADYAELLLMLARLRLNANRLPALTMAGRPSTVRRRVELLLTDGFSVATSMRRSVVAMLAISMIGIVIALGSVQFGRAAAANGDEQVRGEIRLADELEENPPVQQASQPATADAESLAFSGTVVDKESQKPIEGAKVVVRRMLIRAPNRRIIEESEHVTDSNGVYNFVVPPEQAAERRLYIELDVEHPEYAWKKGFGYSLTMIRKNLELGDPPFFSRIELTPAEAITGRVVDPNGQPLPNVKILAYSRADAKDWQDYGSFFRTETDAEGRFRISAAKGGPCVAWIVPALSALVVDLDQRGMLEATIIYCTGEFGRTPHINGAAGRDHWARAMSVFLAGGNFRRGFVHGATDPQGFEPAEDACSPMDVSASVLQSIGVRHDDALETQSGRPIAIIGNGAPITKLFA